MAKKLPEIDPFGFLPIRYEDRRRHVPVSEFVDGVKILFRGRPTKVEEKVLLHKTKVLWITMSGDGGSFYIKFLHYSEYHIEKFRRSGTLSLWGAPKRERNHWVFYQPKAPDETGIVCPIYTAPKGIGQKTLRAHVWDTTRSLLQSLVDEVPPAILAKRALPTISEALMNIHRPSEIPDKLSFVRLAYREIFTMKKQLITEDLPAAPIVDIDVRPFIEQLPFDLTTDQIKAIDDIIYDMSSDTPMRRIVIGDVSSGKTVVCQAAVYACIHAGYKAVVLAPSTVLAEQHLEKFTGIFGQDKVGLCTGKTKSVNTMITIGTHALLNRRLKDIGLVVIDEQHRFGVAQREKLVQGAHSLQLSATPIPRTVNLIYQGTIGVSTLCTVPYRRDVVTRVLPKGHSPQIVSHIKEIIAAGGKALIIYPFVDGEKGDYKSVESTRDYWEREFPNKSLFVHGKSEHKEEIVAEFRTSQAKQLLVATSLIETGIDVPEASIMVVSASERFGLAQLHQLRGRIGRRGNKAFCYFLYKIPEAAERIKILETLQDGFQLAEEDCNTRGWGDALGQAQSGHFLKLPSMSIYKKVVPWLNEDIMPSSTPS
jgi:ATP-dependent DNA helicase RecG